MQIQITSEKAMRELLEAVCRHHCEVSLEGFVIDDDGIPIAIFDFEPCSRTCPISFLFGGDIIVLS